MSIQDRVYDDPPLDVPLGPPGKMTEEEFVAWCDEDTRAEWVDGEVIVMPPQNVDHSEESGWLEKVIGVFVEERGLGIVLQEVAVRLPKRRRRRSPDLLFVANEHRDRIRKAHVEGPPDLIVEIVSPDSVARDWREKYHDYEEAGVREYWVIDPMARHAELYALTPDEAQPDAPGPASYRRLEEKEGVVESAVLPGFRLRISWLWDDTRPRATEALRELGVLSP